MKRTISHILAAAAISLSFVSCNDWLEATSATKIKADELLSTRDGFQDALNGIYISMGNINAYGGSCTFIANDLVAYPANKMLQSASYSWQDHKYGADVLKRSILLLWRDQYFTIANINFLLREMDKQQGVLDRFEENLYRGELYGLRAFLHFDLMRMFGVSEWNSENAGKMAVPYVREYTAQVTPQLSYAETEKLLMADIDSALVRLEADPARGIVPEGFDTNDNIDGFWSSRDKRFNYYAALALKARVFQWKHDYEKAAATARTVAEEALAAKAVKWIDPEVQRNISAAAARDWTFSTEHIFSLEIGTLFANITGYLISNTVSDAIRIPHNFVNEVLFPAIDPETGSLSGAEDLRGPAWLLNYSSLGFDSYKLNQPANYAREYACRMPMIKLSEMYYIMAEYAIANEDNAGAIAALDEVRSHRGIGDALPETADALTELAKECYREFVNEGQIFSWLKHRHMDIRLYEDFAVEEKDLVYPYPDEEIKYGRIQEL